MDRIAVFYRTYLGRVIVQSNQLLNIMKPCLEAIVSFDECQRIVQFDRQAESMFGYSVGEVLQETLGKLFPIYFMGKYEAQMKLFARDGKIHPRDSWLEMRAVRKSGEEFPVEVDITKFRVNNGYVFTAVFKEIL